jgi:phosphomannomutase
MRVDDLALIEDAMTRLRGEPPTTLGGRAVERADDLAEGSDDLPPTDGLRYVLADGGRVVVRPSGTEPKLKAYLEVVVPVTADDVVTARRTATADLAAIKRDVAEALNLG